MERQPFLFHREESFSDDLYDQIARSGTRIEVEKNKLLPCSKRKLAIREGDGLRDSLQLSAKMAVRIIFTGISGVVLPVGVGRG